MGSSLLVTHLWQRIRIPGTGYSIHGLDISEVGMVSPAFRRRQKAMALVVGRTMVLVAALALGGCAA